MSNHSRPSKRPHPSGHDKAKAAVENPVKSLASREMIDRTTLGLYSLKVGDSLYGVPFCALTDKLALIAQKEILPQSNVYKVGTFCQFNGLIVRLSKPLLILDNHV